MNILSQRLIKVTILIASVTFLSSCATTKITQTWIEPDHKKVYNNLLIIALVQSEQNRRAYESNFVEELRSIGVGAEASYTLIKGDQKINRETVKKAIEGMDIDAVLVTNLVAIKVEEVYRPAMDYMPMYGGAYYGGYRGGLGLYSYPYMTTYARSPGYFTTYESYTIETQLYDVKSGELVWSARSNSFAPGSADEVIVDLTKLLIDNMKEKNIIGIK